MSTKNTTRAVMLALLTMIVAACGSAATADEPTTTTSGKEAVSTTAAVVALPDPDYAWDLDGNGKAGAGVVDVEFLGAYETSVNAVAFDGYTGQGLAAEGLVDTTDSFTLSVWANYAKLRGFSAVLSVLGDDSYAAALGIGYDSEWFFATKTADITGLEHAVQVQSAPVVAGSRWTHVVGVYDSDAGVIRLYVDGERVGEAATDALFSAEGPLAIGRGQFDGGPGNFWAGAIDSVAVYQTALNDAQIAALHDGTRPTSPPPSMPAPDPSTYANGILNGTWDYVTNPEEGELIAEGFIAEGLIDSADEVTIRIGFDDHEWWLGFLFDGELFLLHGVPEGDGGTFLIEGDVLALTNYWSDAVYTWTLVGDQLTLEMIEFCNYEVSEPVCADDPETREVTEHIYTKSSDDPSY